MIYTKKYKNVEDRILIDTKIKFKNTDITISNFDNHTQFSMRFPTSENLELK